MVATFIIPVVGNYTLTADFGDSGGLWSSGSHTGQDFAAPKGTGVVASAGGMVTFAGSSGRYGNRVEVTHANGTITTYSHLNSIAVRRFQTVGQGDRVGTIGETGNTTGPHLHFEMKIGGRFVDPMKHLGDAGRPIDGIPKPPPGGGSALPGVDVTAGGTWLRVAYFMGGLVVLGLGFVALKKGGLL